MNPNNRVTYFAYTDARNKRVQFGIKADDRTRHLYVIGKTGMGKSTLLENMAVQDMQNGEGLAFIDPHGKTAEYLLDFVPEHRIKDVLYFAPFDMEYPIAFNVMEDIGPDKRHLVVSGLMSAFKKIWLDAWSARMEYILQNTLLALLEYPGATLIHINKMLSDKDFRKKVVDNITDPTVRSFWVDEFAKYTDRFAAEATPAIQNKVGQFTSNPLIRNIIGQEHSSFDLRKMMDEKKILIINLSKGLVGEGNANLLGSMLITKIYLAAMSRADAPESVMYRLPNFYLYVDEFQSFANESFANILSEARKYKLNLTMAHQYVEQMSEEVRSAVFGNVGTTIVFRVGSFDAELFEKEFMPTFTAEDFVNLGFAQIYLKLMIDGVSSQPFSATTMPAIQKPPVSFKKDVLEMSRQQFGNQRALVEERIEKQFSGNQSMQALKDEHKKGLAEKEQHQKDNQEENRAEKKAQAQPKKDLPKNSSEKKPEKNIGALREALAGVLGEPDLLEENAMPAITSEAVAPPEIAEKVEEPTLQVMDEKPVENTEVEKNNVVLQNRENAIASSSSVAPRNFERSGDHSTSHRQATYGGERRDNRSGGGSRDGGGNRENRFGGHGQNHQNNSHSNSRQQNNPNYSRDDKKDDQCPDFRSALRDVLKTIPTNTTEAKVEEKKAVEVARSENIKPENTQGQRNPAPFKPQFKKVASEEAGKGLQALKGVLAELQAKEQAKIAERQGEATIGDLGVNNGGQKAHKEHQNTSIKRAPVEIPEAELKEMLKDDSRDKKDEKK